jgi:twitching motility protein PilT
MLASPAIKSNIRDGKVYQIPNAMLTQARMGMVLLDNALVNLYRKGVISRENALAFCNEPDEVAKLIGGGVGQI